MPSPPVDSASSDKSASRTRWRTALFVIALCAVVVAAFYVAGLVNRRSNLSARCFDDMFSGRTTQALKALEEYRGVAAGDVPARVHDELFRLAGDKQYPLYRDKADRYLVDRVVLLALAAERALGRARDPGEAAVHAVGYVLHNVQSGGPPEALAFRVTVPQVLCRGFGGPVESAWTVVSLLRVRGAHACVILFPGSKPDTADYAIAGVLIGQKLWLFDPYRGVPVCRASDGCIADLQTLVSGGDAPKPRFGGDGTPVTVERLRTALYLVPADASTVLPDGWLLGDIFRRNGRGEVVYRSFRDDLRNVAAAVFGEGARVTDSFTTMTCEGRGEVVALWDYPFKVDQLLATSTDYYAKLAQAHRAATVYLNERRLHLFGAFEPAREQYGRLLQEKASDGEVVEDVSFFRALVSAKPDERAELLSGYLAKYPAGRWRPLATLVLLELEVSHGGAEAARSYAAALRDTPYAFYADLLAEAAVTRRPVVWTYPPDKAPTTAPAGARR